MELWARIFPTPKAFGAQVWSLEFGVFLARSLLKGLPRLIKFQAAADFFSQYLLSMGFGQVCAQLQRPVEMEEGSLDFSLFAKGNAEIVVRAGVFGIGPQRRRVLSDGFGELAAGGEELAEVVAGVQKARFHAQGGFI